MRRLLLRLYPKKWRSEYGAEFLHVLEARPLGPLVVLDVVWSAIRQRWREEEPAQVIGSVLLAWMLIFLAVNLTFPGPYQQNTFKANWPAVAIFVFTGYVTALRDGKPGRAAMRVQLTCTWPLIVIGFLTLIGALPILVLGPGDPPTTVFDRGLAWTYYHAQRKSPSPFGLMILPLLQLPVSAFYGWLGGLVARAQMRWRRSRAHEVER